MILPSICSNILIYILIFFPAVIWKNHRKKKIRFFERRKEGLFGDSPCFFRSCWGLPCPTAVMEKLNSCNEISKEIANRDLVGRQVCVTGLCHNVVKTKTLLPDLSFFMREQVVRQKYFPATFVTLEIVAVSEGTWESTPHCAEQC